MTDHLRHVGAPGYRVAKAVLAKPLRLAYPMQIEGLHHLGDGGRGLPGEAPVVDLRDGAGVVDLRDGDTPGHAGGLILAANHRSFMDSIFLALATPRPVAFMAKAEYFDRRVSRWVFESTGQIPVRRGSPAGARQAMARAEDVLLRGGVIGVYPEGTRSRDGYLHRGHLGPARLAAATGALLVPVGLLGTDRVQLPSERLPHLRRPITVRFGDPMAVERGPIGQRALRAVTDALMARIAELSGAIYDDTFSPMAGPAALPAAPERARAGRVGVA